MVKVRSEDVGQNVDGGEDRNGRRERENDNDDLEALEYGTEDTHARS